ncbi:uncharacterized protein LOC130998183 [Salvia miltiorrhiza]|uniref:uncharacterized protein LOC130998183 n=1 Tax=Salvia miltiorrhiza TaxID=226208 RepID=UPI0025AB7DC7|nr:uncharacterized protein LOC130998183 [Salvia miltiorrhiza]
MTSTVNEDKWKHLQEAVTKQLSLQEVQLKLQEEQLKLQHIEFCRQDTSGMSEDELYNHFKIIVDAMSNYSPYFTLRQDATGRNGLSPLQKCTASIRQLTYAAPGDSLDEYMRMGESTALECLHEFCRSMIAIYGDRYLRSPNAADTQRLLQMHEERHGFPGMLGSLDCMHWDLGVEELPCRLQRGNAPPVQFMVNGRMYNRWNLSNLGFIRQELPSTRRSGQAKISQRQEAARKDIERAFGVLQARWAVVRNPARSYFKEDLRNIMLTCIILHNMIIEDEGEEAVNWSDEDATPQQPIPMSTNNWEAFEIISKITTI